MTSSQNSAAKTVARSLSQEGQLVLQITDLHLLSEPGRTLLGVDTAHSFAAVLNHALAKRTPDAMVVTGDIAHDALPATYQHYWQTLSQAFTGPVLSLPGNHDIAAEFAQIPTPRNYSNSADSETGELALGNWLLLALDSHQDDIAESAVSVTQWRQIQARIVDLAANDPEKQVLIVTHHPPMDINCPWLDKDRIQLGQQMLKWSAHQNNVRGFVFGHVHQQIDAVFEQLVVLGTPSTCFQFLPASTKFAIDDAKPGYRWLELGPQGQIHSQVERLNDYHMTPDLKYEIKI